MNYQRIISAIIILLVLAVATTQPASAAYSTGPSFKLTLGTNITVLSVVEDTGYAHNPACDPTTSTTSLCAGPLTATANGVTITISSPAGSTITWGGAMASCTGQTCTIATPGETAFSGSVIATIPAPTPAPAPVQAPTQPKTTEIQTQDEAIKTQLNTTSPMSELKINGAELSSKTRPSFDSDSTIVLSGKTIPNATVRLYIFSTPREAIVQADENGVWSYSIENLEPGVHRVETVVTDPATKQESDRIELLAFNILQPNESLSESSAAVEPSSGGGFVVSLLLIGAALIGIIGAVFYLVIRKKRLNDKTSDSIQTEDTEIPSEENTQEEDKENIQP